MFFFDGAGEGNRTPVSTLGRLRSTIELHLQMLFYFSIARLGFFKKKEIGLSFECYGAGEGNRTLVSTLARSRSTIELHLHDGGPDGDRTRDLLRDREAC